MVDRSQRYANPPKAPKKGGSAPPEEGEAERKAEATAGSPRMESEGKTDPGPEGGHDATWGVVAERHKREHGDMLKRHKTEHDAHKEAHSAMVDRHHKEASDMLKRHQEEFKTAFQGPGNEIEQGGGEGPKLGASKSEGTKGTEA